MKNTMLTIGGLTLLTAIFLSSIIFAAPNGTELFVAEQQTNSMQNTNKPKKEKKPKKERGDKNANSTNSDVDANMMMNSNAPIDANMMNGNVYTDANMMNGNVTPTNMMPPER